MFLFNSLYSARNNQYKTQFVNSDRNIELILIVNNWVPLTNFDHNLIWEGEKLLKLAIPFMNGGSEPSNTMNNSQFNNINRYSNRNI